MEKGKIIITYLCIATVAMTFKSCGNYILKREAEINSRNSIPIEYVQESSKKEKEKELTDYEKAKEELEEAIEKIKTR